VYVRNGQPQRGGQLPRRDQALTLRELAATAQYADRCEKAESQTQGAGRRAPARKDQAAAGVVVSYAGIIVGAAAEGRLDSGRDAAARAGPWREAEPSQRDR
jgi:hypothetical protein